MIVIDPYFIDAIIVDRIVALREAGALASIEPDGKFGYSCEAVFGVRSDQIIAAHLDGDGDPQVRLFQLTELGFINANPVNPDRIAHPLLSIIH